jgi:hypothetical protein
MDIEEYQNYNILIFFMNGVGKWENILYHLKEQNHGKNYL